MTGTSKEYAVALFGLAVETGTAAEIAEGLALVRKVFEDTPEFSAFLSSPGIPKQERLQLIQDTFSEDVPEYVVSFLSLLCEHGDAPIFMECANEFDKLYSQSKNVSYAVVTSVVELTDDEKTKLCAKLEHINHNKVIIEYRIDPSLLGGLTVEMDGLILDGSLKRRLHNMKEVMDE